jgi:branched-chain amino acid transport system permease protein
MRWLGTALIAGSLLLPPFLAGDFYINLASQILIAAIFALSLNLLVGFGGMTSLGHASYLGVAAYISALLTSKYGFGHGTAAIISMSGTLAMAGFFGLIALRATGLGFLMITLALSQVLWGLAYRMSNVTNFLMMTIFVSSAFGSSLRGVRDQPRRMAALGFNPWLIRWITFVYAGFWGGVSGLLYVYYHKYIHPTSLSTTSSAEALLGVIAGGSGTLGGPIAGAALVLLLKNYASAYVERSSCW